MVISVRRRDPRKDAAKARAIAHSGQSVMFTGAPRQLRKIAAQLGGDPNVRTFLGDDDQHDRVVLVVDPASEPGRGSLLWQPVR